MRTIKYIVFLSIFMQILLFAQSDRKIQNFWQIGFTFGEIPVLSGSFKPGITLGYQFNDHLMAEFTFQLKDYLQRDEESFNAVNIGYDGLTSSKETTGERIFLGLRYKPVKWSPYLTAGVVLNLDDVETIKYDYRERVIGNNIYEGNIDIVQTRKSGIAPALGFGYEYDFSNGLAVNTNFAMAFFNDIPTAKITVKSDKTILESDLKLLKKKIDYEYKGNFHNRYHIFNLGLSYKFN